MQPRAPADPEAVPVPQTVQPEVPAAPLNLPAAQLWHEPGMDRPQPWWSWPAAQWYVQALHDAWDAWSW